jgi:hypothetical protein
MLSPPGGETANRMAEHFDEKYGRAEIPVARGAPTKTGRAERSNSTREKS